LKGSWYVGEDKMNLSFLGSGGSVAIPRPFCSCITCTKARVNGVPWARTGPSLFVANEEILFDTPEEIRFQIEREKIQNIRSVFYTHWHPDHTQGMRIFEHIQYTQSDESRKTKKPIGVYLPERAMADFAENCKYLFYYQKCNYIELSQLADRVPMRIGTLNITPIDFRRADRVRYGYLLEEGSKRVMYAPCSVFQAVLDSFWLKLDLLIIELGWLNDSLITRSEIPRSNFRFDHISFNENIELIKKINPKSTILTHVEGTRHHIRDGDLDFLKEKIDDFPELRLDIAYDGMMITT
jgi:phosphoribosyl 1,2-cyclic phosphate phosphodiesterase